MAKNELRVKVVGLDSDRNILLNCSSSALVGGANLFLLPFALFMAYLTQSAISFLCLFSGVVIGAVWFLYRPPNIFFISEIWTRKRMILTELDTSALRVLTFFKSRQAAGIIFSITGVLACLITSFWFLLLFVLPHPTAIFPIPWPANIETLIGLSFGSGFFLIIVSLLDYLGFLSWYVLKRWDNIQKNYAPWPTSEMFELPLKTIFKPKTWKRTT